MYNLFSFLLKTTRIFAKVIERPKGDLNVVNLNNLETPYLLDSIVLDNEN